MKSDELRKTFLDFFKERKHTVVPSASLVPEGDPTLLFNIAGMVQFKQFYAAKGTIPFLRAASVQKCLRATDLEEVGRTIKHHTFFEMLGNFSFGDYFKEEAIEWAWDFITRVLAISTDRLYVTVFEDDEESERIWTERMGVSRERVHRLGCDDNFWGPAGLTGACGPCSEIHYDMGEHHGCGKPECSPACDCDRFVEVWNLVFPEFYQEANGTRGPLERRGVDTGMGLERLAMVCQGVGSNYETDLFKPIIDFVRDEADLESLGPAQEIAVRVISDHARALCFAICEGVLPSNEGRGYVIRRILRRAVVRGLELGIEKAFLFKVVGKVIDIMRNAYPEIADSGEKIALIVKADEERFERTLARGMAIFRETLEDLKARNETVVSGQAVFRLYDTFGFPIEITQELADNQGFTIDEDGFNAEMERQRERARESSKIGTETGAVEDTDRVPDTFVGYDSLEVPTVVSAITGDCGTVTKAYEGQQVEMELERTPFYPEGGGQVGDVGVVVGSGGRGVVADVRWLGGHRISHRVSVEAGSLSIGDGVVAKVDVARRKATQRNHTATHLLHAALRSVLGSHVRQSGSLVAPDRLRFDFTHYEPLSAEEIERVEDAINRKVVDNIPVCSSIQAFEDAKAKGAMALFGEKYGQDVRMIEIEDTSCELCGGTHVDATGEIGTFRMVSESGIAAGVRRIEAVTGHVAIQISRDTSKELEEISSILKVPVRDAKDGARKIAERVRELEKELADLHQRLAGVEVETLVKDVKDVKGIPVVTARVEAPNVELLKQLADRVRDRLQDGVVCLASVSSERVFVVVSVSPDLAKRTGLKASAVAKKVGEMVGGRGGGKDTFAQAGGKDVGMVEAALERVPEVITGFVG
jgi:alanyl-tRNA synthetase